MAHLNSSSPHAYSYTFSHLPLFCILHWHFNPGPAVRFFIFPWGNSVLIFPLSQGSWKNRLVKNEIMLLFSPGEISAGAYSLLRSAGSWIDPAPAALWHNGPESPPRKESIQGVRKVEQGLVTLLDAAPPEIITTIKIHGFA